MSCIFNPQDKEQNVPPFHELWQPVENIFIGMPRLRHEGIDFDALRSWRRVFTMATILRNERVEIVNTFQIKDSLIISLVNIFYRIPICCTLLNAIIHEKLTEPLPSLKAWASGKNP